MSFRNVVLIPVGSKPRITVLRLLNNVLGMLNLWGMENVTLGKCAPGQGIFSGNSKMAFLLAKPPTMHY